VRLGVVAALAAAIRGVDATALNLGSECDRRGSMDMETGEVPCDREEEEGCACSQALEFAGRAIKNLRSADIDKIVAGVIAKLPTPPASPVSDSPAPAGAEVTYQYREIGEGEGWRDCSRATYDSFRADPHIDTREVSSTPAPVRDDGAREALRTEMVAALDGFTDYSRDCHLSGEFLCSKVWPLVLAAIPASDTPSQDQGAVRGDGVREALAYIRPIFKDSRRSGLEWSAVEAERAFDLIEAAALASPGGAGSGKREPLVRIDPQARAGKEPCGECHLRAGETCDICGAKAPPAPQNHGGAK
jgi:hypothetical protein